MAATNNIAIEKGPMGYFTNISDDHQGGASSAALPIRTYAHDIQVVHDTPPEPKGLASAGPLGFFSIATTMFILSMYDIQARGVTVPNAIIGMASFVGGLSLFVAGMLEFINGNMLAASAFSCYGGFWLAYAAILHPGFGVAAAYADYPDQLSNALGIFLAAWFILTTIFLLATLKVNLLLIILFFLLDLTFLFLMMSEFSGNLTVHKIGGGACLATSAVAFYGGAASLFTKENAWFTLPVGTIRRDPN